MRCQLCWTVASMVVLESKSIADAMVCACRKLLRDLSGVKPRTYLIQRIGAYSLPPARVTRSVCLRVRSLSLYDETLTAISARLQRTV